MPQPRPGSLSFTPHAYEKAEYEEWERLTSIDQIVSDARMFDKAGNGADVIPELAPDD